MSDEDKRDGSKTVKKFDAILKDIKILQGLLKDC